jgi:AGCS family alanine or glycine:cation symporter
MTRPTPPARTPGPEGSSGGGALRALARLVLAALLCLGPAAAWAEEGEPEPGLQDRIDAAFGEYVVGPMAAVMFFDLWAWDANLPEGALPPGHPETPYTEGELQLIEHVEGKGYVFRRRHERSPSELQLVPDDQEILELAPGVRLRLAEEGGKRVVAAVAPGPVELESCSSFDTCGTPVEEAGRLIRDEAGTVVELESGPVIIPSPPDVPTRIVVVDDVPVAVREREDGGGLQLLASVAPFPREKLPLTVGRTVRVDGETAEVVALGDTTVTVLDTASTTKAGPLPNPDDIQIPVVVAWLVFGALFFTLRMQFINLRGFAHALRVTAGHYDDDDEEGEISHFKALSSALSATVGLGNIAGVALAVAAGGPGAIPWMVIAGFLGMSSKFTECTLGQVYRTRDVKGRVSGGPMHYLDKGLREKGMGPLGKVLGVVFAVMCIGGSLGGGNMFQSNQSFAMVATMAPGLADMPGVFGGIMALLVGLVILGGIKSIGAVAGVIVPVMCGVYVLAALYILGVHAAEVPKAFGIMFDSAFSFQAAGGGAIGALIQGFRRAAFSNEAGVGSASIAHSAAATKEPVREGIVALLEPFIDTIVVCTMTGLVVVITGAYEQPIGDGVEMTAWAFGSVLTWFPTVLSIAVVLFAFSTMISWSYYGERCATHLFGPGASLPYKLLFVTCTWMGAWLKLGNVLDFSDLMILGMAFPNILGLLILSGDVRRRLDDYWGRLQSGEMKPVGR